MTERVNEDREGEGQQRRRTKVPFRNKSIIKGILRGCARIFKTLSSDDTSTLSVATWLPTVSGLLRPQAGVFRDEDDLHHSTLGHLAQLIRLMSKSLGTCQAESKPRIKIIKVHGVKNEIDRALRAIESFIQNMMSMIAELYSSHQAANEEDPELSYAQQALIYLRSKLYKISALRKKFTVIRNSGKRSTLDTISKIFSALIQRSASRHHHQPLEQISGHKQVAKA